MPLTFTYLFDHLESRVEISSFYLSLKILAAEWCFGLAKGYTRSRDQLQFVAATPSSSTLTRPRSDCWLCLQDRLSHHRGRGSQGQQWVQSDHKRQTTVVNWWMFAPCISVNIRLIEGFQLCTLQVSCSQRHLHHHSCRCFALSAVTAITCIGPQWN